MQNYQDEEFTERLEDFTKHQKKIEEQQEKIKEQQEEIKKQQEEIDKQQEKIKKQQEEFKKQQEEIDKQQEEIKKQQEEFKKQQEEFKKQQDEINKAKTDISRIDASLAGFSFSGSMKYIKENKSDFKELVKFLCCRAILFVLLAGLISFINQIPTFVDSIWKNSISSTKIALDYGNPTALYNCSSVTGNSTCNSLWNCTKK